MPDNLQKRSCEISFNSQAYILVRVKEPHTKRSLILPSMDAACWDGGSHSSDYGKYSLLGCNTM
jgi:hypothetical protein